MSPEVEVEVLSLRDGPLRVDGLARYLDWDLYRSRGAVGSGSGGGAGN